jgi:EmrB/QacA subfamily drug resistance transporter
MVQEASSNQTSIEGQFVRTQLFGILAGLMLALLLVALDQTILTAATPQIIANLQGFERYPWISNAYLLTSTIVIPLFGKLADLYSRKRLFLVGIGVFILASACCGFAGLLPLPLDGMNQLIVCRGLQGIAAGIINSLTFILIGDIFPPAVRGKYQGLFASVWILASLFGPTLGGFLAEQASWRWIFFLNIPVGLIAAMSIILFFPSLAAKHIKHRLDYWGTVTLSIGLIALMLALTLASTAGWISGTVITLLCIAVIALVIFVQVEMRTAEPILPLTLFGNSIIVLSGLSILLSALGAYGVILYLPLFMQQVMHISVIESGALLTPSLILLMLANIGSGLLLASLGRYKWLTVGGLVCMAAGALVLCTLNAQSTVVLVVVGLILLAIGLGITTPLYTIISQNAVSHSQLGVITAFTQFIRQIGVALGTAIVGTMMLSLYQTDFDRAIPPGASPSLLAPFRDPLGIAQHLPALQKQFALQPGGSQLFQTLLNSMTASLRHALTQSFLICAIVLVLITGFNFFLKEIPLRKSNTETKPIQEEIN